MVYRSHFRQEDFTKSRRQTNQKMLLTVDLMRQLCVAFSHGAADIPS